MYTSLEYKNQAYITRQHYSIRTLYFQIINRFYHVNRSYRFNKVSKQIIC